MSWLAAARNLVLEILAASASPLARASAALSRVSSSVRSCTRRSSVSLARSSASAASTLAVMSVKVVTMPPSGMRLARTSITMPARRSARGTARGRRCSARAARARTRRCARDRRRRAWPLKRRISASPMPTRIRLGGRSRISPNCRFQQISCRSLSNTAMPWRTWSSAVCRISRLYWIAALASSSSFSAALVDTVRLRSSSESTSREDAAADRGGEHVLGVAHQAEIGLVLWLRG